MSRYVIEVRSADGWRTLGHLLTPLSSDALPNTWTFPLRGSVEDPTTETVTLEVARFTRGGGSWRAFKVPAAQWAKIKGRIEGAFE